MAYTNLKDARECVQNREIFDGNNCYAIHQTDDRYVVYSYGSHWPLFVHEHGVWYENVSKYSRTTSKHHSVLHPLCDTTPMEFNQMQVLAESGIVGLSLNAPMD